jgi:N-acetylglucosamine-6-phosphate deacetylase
MSMVFYNGRVFTGDNFIDGAHVQVQGDVIASVGSHAGILRQGGDPDGVNLQGDMLVPAFIDIQLYGGNGQLFGEHPSVESLKATVEYSRAGGAAYILPTVATNSAGVMNDAIQAVREYHRQRLPGVVGLHLEGPFISTIKRGAHIPEFIRKPTLADAKDLVQAGGDVLKLMTLAPEVCPPEVISYLQEKGIVISAGHTDATFDQAMHAFDNGVSMATHLFNVMSPFNHRAPGVVGAALHHPTAYASIIPDGHHVDYAVISIAKKIMGERLFIITDAVTENIAGYYQHRLQGDKYVVADGTLSGSALTMIQAVRNCIKHAGISLEESLRMASLYPARVLKLDHALGRIAPQYMAELLWLDDQLKIKGMYTNGALTRFAN